MSKIAANDAYGGNLLRKAIDYFCHCASRPTHVDRIAKGDKTFAASEFFPAMTWLKDVTDDIYDPSYTDMLRVAFASEFGAASCRTWWLCYRDATSTPSSTRRRLPRRPSAG